ncbi:MAG: type II toxin-antitoxin system HicB family antitoxin [Methylomicrobium sp.]
MMYLAIIEPTRNGFTGYSPDIPVCSVKGVTEKDVQEALSKAIKSYVEKLRESGLEIPRSQCKTAIIQITA